MIRNLKSKAQVAKDWQAFLRDCKAQIHFEQREAQQLRVKRRRGYSITKFERHMLTGGR
jgi:hypothetical protein